MGKAEKVAVVWLRRDLRLFDNAALYHALNSGSQVLIMFIFDKNILDKLQDKKDKRVDFIYRQLEKINSELHQYNSSLLVYHNTPKKAFEELLSNFDVQEVFTNRDYEPYALERDREINDLLESKNIPFQTFKDQVIFERSEVMKPDGSPYTVFTPYSNKWKERLHQESIPEYPSESRLDHLLKRAKVALPSLENMGFEPSGFEVPDSDLSEGLIRNYEKTRNLPAVHGTSYASVHLRFGTVSIRRLVKQALQQNEIWLNELIWREFFMQILYHFPEVVEHNFRRKYDRIQWRNNEREFELWCRGETGYPMVDAGMRQLNETGWMHNRVRMITAGFLTKHLLIDWRWGEAYFAEKLVDYELSSNNGNWQWAAGTGCDSAPYFRIFNPETQLKKFDPKLEYVKTWIKDFRAGYLEPIVEHKFARARALEAYKKALNN
ncbi:cryptochrome/photolyase family protein [Salinimicrobium soli]